MRNAIKLISLFLIGIVIAACSDRSPDTKSQEKDQSTNEKQISLDCPVEGVWTLKENLGFDLYYVISLSSNKNGGVISVESKGLEVASHKFNIVDSKTIHIHDATGECYNGDIMSGEEWQALFQLKAPPENLIFTNVPLGGEQTAISTDAIFMAGLFSIKDAPFSIPLRRIKPQTRIPLPFEITVDWRVEVPKGVELSLGGDGLWGAAMLNAKFKEPVHPIGYVKSLQIEGHQVALENTQLDEGLLSTKEFGDIEFFLLGPGGDSEVWATREQIKAIAEMIASK